MHQYDICHPDVVTALKTVHHLRRQLADHIHDCTGQLEQLAEAGIRANEFREESLRLVSILVQSLRWIELNDGVTEVPKTDPPYPKLAKMLLHFENAYRELGKHSRDCVLCSQPGIEFAA
jgi:hypothetical protein